MLGWLHVWWHGRYSLLLPSALIIKKSYWEVICFLWRMCTQRITFLFITVCLSVSISVCVDVVVCEWIYRCCTRDKAVIYPPRMWRVSITTLDHLPGSHSTHMGRCVDADQSGSPPEILQGKEGSSVESQRPKQFLDGSTAHVVVRIIQGWYPLPCWSRHGDAGGDDQRQLSEYSS